MFELCQKNKLICVYKKNTETASLVLGGERSSYLSTSLSRSMAYLDIYKLKPCLLFAGACLQVRCMRPPKVLLRILYH